MHVSAFCHQQRLRGTERSCRPQGPVEMNCAVCWGRKELSNVFFRHFHWQSLHHDFSALLTIWRASPSWTPAATATVASAATSISWGTIAFTVAVSVSRSSAPWRRGARSATTVVISISTSIVCSGVSFPGIVASPICCRPSWRSPCKIFIAPSKGNQYKLKLGWKLRL